MNTPHWGFGCVFYGYFPLGNGYFTKINRKKKDKYMKKKKRTKLVDNVSLK